MRFFIFFFADFGASIKVELSFPPSFSKSGQNGATILLLLTALSFPPPPPQKEVAGAQK